MRLCVQRKIPFNGINCYNEETNRTLMAEETKKDRQINKI